LHLLKKTSQLWWGLDHSTIFIGAHMHRISFRQKHSIVFVNKSIIKSQSQFAPERKGGLYANNIVIAGWFMVATIGFVYWQKTTTSFPRPISASSGPEKLGATDFKPFQVIGIIGYPHGIGITV
jgi:hypothetical protein